MLKRTINSHVIEVKTTRVGKKYWVEVSVDGEKILAKKIPNLRFVEIVHKQDESNCYFQNEDDSTVYLKVVSYGYKYKYIHLDFEF